ncbi:MAG TPA: methyltransferase [Micrococcaceae bacterium]
MTDFADVPYAPKSHDLQLLRALERDLSAVNYTVDGVQELLGGAAYEAFNRDQLVPAVLATKDGGGLATLIRLWLLAEPVAEVALFAALPETGLVGLLALGLAEQGSLAGTARAAVDLRPYGWPPNRDGSGGADLWVASDLGAHQRPGVLPKDHVLGIGHASLTLAQSTIRPRVERALDLGTGCGIQTFHLLQHAEHVVATDISERALAFTRFNLLLNAGPLRLDPEDLEDRVELRQGSLLEPVDGERFALVVSNPPFVITPRHRSETVADQFTYRDGGLLGDEIVATLVNRLPEVLASGGIAQMLGNWEIRGTDGPGTDSTGTRMAAGVPAWYSRPQSWLPDGVDAWFIQRERIGPGQYAETWLRDASEGRDRALYAESYADYLLDFASRNVTGIGFGMIWLRRPPERDGDAQGPRIRRFEEITHPIEQPIGPHLGAAIARADWLGSADLSSAHLLVAEDVTEERHQRPGAEHPGVILLRQGAGLRRTNLLSTELAGFVSACDGDLSAAQIAGALSALLGWDGSGAERRIGLLLDDVRNLVLDGFLLPTG